MSSKGKISTIRVAVCGLTSSCYNGLGGQGPGKSCLCNRLIQSTHDKLHTDHTSVLNLSEFGSNVINNTHFLYWGEKVAVLEDGQEMKFQIVEHTEFVDDSSLKPFSTNKPYHKRCIQLKLQSGGKVTYLEPNQLALPEQYIDVPKFPDKFAVDGFIVCVDVSTNLDDHSDPQKEFFDRVLHNIIGIKKPVVIACTKFDRCKPASMASVLEIVAKSKKQVPVVEVSAVKGVNVDMCFLVLAHLIDPKKPRTRIVSYAESKAQLDERVRRNEEALQYVLDERLVDFSMSLEEANQCLKPIVEYQLLIDLSGKQRVNRLIKAKLNYLKSQLVKYKSASFMKALPHVFTAIVPELELGVTIETAKVKLRRSSKFERYFIDLEDWKENTEFLKSDTEDLVPFSLLDMDEGKGLLETHIDEVLAEGRARVAAEKIKEVLNKTTDILPGVDMTMLWVELGLSADIKRISSEEQVQIYNEYMGKLEQVCVADLTELFLEKSDLFDTISTTSHTKDTFDLVHQELKDVPRYKRLDHRTQLRMSQALKHIGSLQVPGRSPVYGKSGLQDAIETLQNTAMLSRDKLGPGACASEQGEGPCWELDHEGSDIRLCILARTEENMRILRSDFMNHCSGSGAVEVGDKTYHIDMSIQHGHHIHSLATDFVPHGAVAVVTSLECVDWLEDLVARLWGGGDDTTTAPYRGMPLIILALDKETEAPDGSKHGSDVYSGAQAVAGEVQCVCITEFPTPQPMRLVGTSVIHQILLSMVNAFSHLHMFLTSDLSLPKDPAGFNIAVCTLVGDPYPNEDLLRPLLRHQLVYSVKDGHNLFVKCAIEKQHRTCVLSFNSMFNVPELCSGIHLGFILVYSTQRIASLSVLKYLLPKLPSIPKLIVAMTTNKSHDKKCLEEGQQLASQWGAMLVSNSEDELRAGFPTEFLHKCWFQRFSSWKAQNYNDEVRLRGRKQARALPSRPTEEVPGPPSLNPSRHSVDTLLDSVVTVETGLSASTTLPRSPIKPSIFKGSLGSSEESDIYSSPVQQRPKKKLSLPLSPPFGGISPHHHHQLPSIQSGPNILDPAPLEPLGDYASVEDAVKHTQMTAGMVNSLRRQARRTPSMSPPPLPTSPPHVPLEQLGEEEDELDTYATVDTIPRVKSPQQKGYDHLLTEDTTHRGGYDHLNPSPPAPSRPPRNEPPPRSQGSPSASTSGRGTPVYDTMEEREGPMYATIDVCKPKQKRLPPRPVATRSPSPSPKPLPAIKPKPRPPLSDTVDDSMYATVNKPSPGGHQRIKSDDLHNVSGELEQMYSVVQKKPRPQPKPRQSPTPDEPMYSVPEKKKKPPPLAPKPTSASNSRSPTPNTGKDMRIEPRPLANHKHGWTHIRSESFDTGLLTSAPHHSDMRDTRSQSVNQQKRQAVHKKALSDQRSPSPEFKTFSSLPNSYRNRARSRECDIHRAKSKEELPSHKVKEPSPRLARNLRIPPSANPTPNCEMEWEEDAPPLPDRNYSWSDIEDDDDELLQSDDDLDEPMTITEHQKLYSTIRRLSIHTPNTIEDIYNVVNRIRPNDTPTSQSVAGRNARSEWLPKVQEEEQVYDTLESIVNTYQKPSATPTPMQGVGGASAAALPTSSEAMLTPREIKLIKHQQKLLHKLQKKLEKESEHRRRQEERKRRREEEQLKKERRKKAKKSKYPQKHAEPAERSRYFGSPLSHVVGSDGVPEFIRKCVDFIEHGGGKGMDTVGLYRVSGKKDDILALQEKYDQDPTLDITTLGLFESCISSTLKAFFKLLPEPLISNELASQLLVINALDAESQRTRIHEILASMPHPNLSTFRYLMQHLYNVQSQQEVNKMNASNLAIVFWPTLMRPPLMDLADPSKQLGWQLVMTRVIEHPDFVPIAL